MNDTANHTPSTGTAWIEIDIDRLRRNFGLIRADMPGGLALMSVVKEQAYGHGALAVAREALRAGASHLAVGSLEEAIELREAGVSASILIHGERPEIEWEACVRHRVMPSINSMETARGLARLARRMGQKVGVHVKVDTGLSRYV